MTAVTKQTKQILTDATRCAVGGQACTPSDTPGAASTPSNTDPQGTTLMSWGLHIGTAGNVQVTMADGTGPVVFEGLVAGQVLPYAVAQVWATNTTATNIVFLY